MKKRIVTWIYEWACKLYIKHAMSEMERHIYEQMKDGDVMVTSNFELVFEADGELLDAIESERSVKH